jgi:pimeloyl-ACP methyl ester carboxylesterase
LLVLPCSLGTSHELWDPAPYTQHSRVLRCEHRGHGKSETPPAPYEMEELGTDALALLVQRIPGARRIVLEGLAHLANLERPAAFARAALAHLEAT